MAQVKWDCTEHLTYRGCVSIKTMFRKMKIKNKVKTRPPRPQTSSRSQTAQRVPRPQMLTLKFFSSRSHIYTRYSGARIRGNIRFLQKDPRHSPFLSWSVLKQKRTRKRLRRPWKNLLAFWPLLIGAMFTFWTNWEPNLRFRNIRNNFFNNHATLL